jgi:hypothetical protein
VAVPFTNLGFTATEYLLYRYARREMLVAVGVCVEHVLVFGMGRERPVEERWVTMAKQRLRDPNGVYDSFHCEANT